jgi:hypothetical protein
MKECYLEYNERHGLPVLNAENPLEPVRRLLDQLDGGEAQLTEIRRFSHKVPKLRGYTVIPMYRVEGVKKGKELTAPEYNGHYICEEYHGGLHPLLITPPEMVQPNPRHTEKTQI